LTPILVDILKSKQIAQTIRFFSLPTIFHTARNEDDSKRIGYMRRISLDDSPDRRQ
jgi:hypothetical protein